jgi:hypothetical protein
VSVFVGQLPPADMARLKAELAETLIAHFCYPRFFDYRTDTLRSRPVDRAKRQEVWLYLSAYDFSSWNKVDLMSSDIQRHIERLFIQFVQRNRNFFGEQGRKRMSDIRMLIGSSATSVVQGLRDHVSGHQQTSPSFGSPRPVASWSTTISTGFIEPDWESMAPVTMVIQQQMQEVRNEHTTVSSPTPTIPQSDPYPFTTSQSERIPTTGGLEREVLPATLVTPPQAVPAPQKNGNSTLPPPNPRVATPSTVAWSAAPTAPVPTVGLDGLAFLLEAPADSAAGIASPSQTAHTPNLPTDGNTTQTHIAEQGQLPASSSSAAIIPQNRASTSLPVSAANQRNNSATLVNEEDIAIFEQLRHQLIIWLRIEAIRSGIEIANQAPSQLMEVLRQSEKCDETRLQIVSTLLNLANQVVRSGNASPFDYKQALMFHLMHTKR